MSTSNPLREDYLYLQPQIIDRLVSQMPAGEQLPVEGAERMGQVLDNDQRPLVVWVVWGGDRFSSGTPAGASQARQGWIVLLVMRNAAFSADARNSVAGPWLARLHNALNGWRPSGLPGGPQFARVQGPKPDYRTASAIYPLAFEIPVHF